MIYYSISKPLINNVSHFFDISYYSLIKRMLRKKGVFVGWGRKRSGRVAQSLARRLSCDYLLLEDGFIRSKGLGVDGERSFSIVEDDVGIYYDATQPSRLENLLNHFDFEAAPELIERAKKSIKCIKDHHISKYNQAIMVEDDIFSSDVQRVLVVAQTAGDASLKYGMGEVFSTDSILQAARAENPEAEIYLKIHPDVLAGKKISDIQLKQLPSDIQVLHEDYNPISLLSHFDKVYTKTSQMGFEALMLGKKVVCFGVPFYSGWGLTDDRVHCERRTAIRSSEEVFAAAYILYSRYVDPVRCTPMSLEEVLLRFGNSDNFSQKGLKI